MRYRPEIQGLRAIAIVPVLVYHAGFSWLPAGFFGVDVFFVISGYLITNILLEEIKTNNFSFINFYKRRIRRLLPVLLVVLYFTIVAGVLLFPASRLEELSQSIIAVLAFVSNIYFFNTINYFSVSAEQIPLLHTWSLAIEEQFYLFFPIVLLFFKKKSEKALLFIILLCTVASLSIAIYLVEKQSNSMAFYFIISRGWELLIGSVTAVVLRNYSFQIKHLDTLGILCIVLPMLFAPKSFGHPSFMTVVPVLGTALIILNSNKSSLVFKLLTRNSLIYIGALSYSLYLWHQPVFSFTRFLTIGELSAVQVTIAFLITVLFSVFSYKYIELNFNKKSYIKDSFFYPLILAGSVLLVVLCSLTIINKGFPERINTSLSLPKSSPDAKACHLQKGEHFDETKICRSNTTRTSTAVLGDSHAIELSYVIGNKLRKNNDGVTHLTYSACAPSLLYAIKGKEACFQWLNESVEYLVKNDEIQTVVLAFRYSGHIFGTKEIYEQDFKEAKLEFVDKSKNATGEKLDNVTRSFLFLINKLLESNKKLIIVLPIPEHKAHIDTFITPSPVFTQLNDNTLFEALTLIEYKTRNNYIRELITGLSDENISVIDPIASLCDEVYCAIGDKTQLYYYDSHHLSIAGATKLVNDYPTF